MRKGFGLASLFVILTNINLVNASNEILLKSRRFTPTKGITAATREKIEAVPGRAHILIQLERIPTIKERKELDAKGIKLLSYIPNKAWFASIPSDKVIEIAVLSNVRSICEILPEDKISPVIRGGVDTINTNADGTVNLAVAFFGDVSLANAAKTVSNYGGVVYGGATVANALMIKISNQKILDLQNEDAVQWITGASILPTKFNDDSRAAICVDPLQELPYNLSGTGVIAGEWDGGWVDITHDDLEGRVIIGDTGSGTDRHATCVAGTMLGDGSINLTYRGMATNATVISYEWWDNIDELNIEYDSAINTHGIDLSTNSWGLSTDYYGCDIMGDYLNECRVLDKIVIGSLGKRIPIIWSAGNERFTNWPYCGYYGHWYVTRRWPALPAGRPAPMQILILRFGVRLPDWFMVFRGMVNGAKYGLMMSDLSLRRVFIWIISSTALNLWVM